MAKMADSKVLQVGSEFSSIQAVLSAMERFEAEQKVSYWRRDSRTLAAARKRGQAVQENAEIQYQSIKYACIKGGKQYVSKSSGKRPNQSSFRDGCESSVHFRASRGGEKLVVVSLNCKHNHPSSDETHQLLPKFRRLSKEESSEVELILASKPSNKVVQQHVYSTYGKKVTLRDLKNISAKMKGCPRSLEDILQGICERQDTIVEVITDDPGAVCAIYYQDAEMQKKFADYPEFLMADATYKLNELSMPVFIQVVVDGNGESEIVSVFVIVSEDRDTVKCLLDIFQKHNPAWRRTRTVLADADIAERSVYKELMPDADLQLCVLNVLKTMKREIHCERMGIRTKDKAHCLEIIQAMAYSQTEAEYAANLQELRDTGVQPVVEHVEKSWHGIRSQWVGGLRESCYYKSSTTSPVEGVNQRLKRVINRCTNLHAFFRDLEVVVQSLRQDRDGRIAKVLNKRPHCRFPNSSPEARYVKLLTPHAYQNILVQMALREKVDLPAAVSGKSRIQLQTASGTVQVTESTCTCKFVVYNRLPCRHIFAVRAMKELDLFTVDEVAERWKLEFYVDHGLTTSPKVSDAGPAAPKTVASGQNVLSKSEKYKSAFTVAQQLATVASQESMFHYQQRLAVLSDVLKLWEGGHQVRVSRIDYKGPKLESHLSKKACLT